MAMRTGTELLVEQTADWLREAGHTPVVYSPLVGPLCMQMRKRGHLVFDRIGQVQVAPDVIHGHHAGPTMTALAAFPNVPAMFVSNSAEAEFDRPPFHPNIRRYFAVSEFLREFWASSEVPQSQIDVLGNPVDTSKFLVREPPKHPATALMVAKYDSQINLIRNACASRGLQLEEVGDGVGRVSDDLPAMFRRADIVFGSGRSALEAAASGCAVVLTERNGTYGMVQSAAIEHIIGLNWGIRLLSQRPTEQAILEAIDKYDEHDVRKVATKVRDLCSLDLHGRKLLSIYAELKASGPGNNPEQATASFIESYVPSLGDERWRALAQSLPLEPFVPPSSIVARKRETQTSVSKAAEAKSSKRVSMPFQIKTIFSKPKPDEVTSNDPRDQFISKVTKGKTFIDVGGLSEVYKERVSIAHAAGAKSITMLDVEKPECPWWDELRHRLDEKGIGECTFITEDATSEQTDPETYDVVHSSGVLYHLPMPLAYLTRLRKMTREWCILTSSTLPRSLEVDGDSINFPDSSVLFIPALAEKERAIIIEWYRRRGRGDVAYSDDGHRNLANYYPNWFMPTIPAFKAMAVCAGFEIVDEAPVEPEELSYCLLLR